MDLIIGGAYQGKLAYAMEHFHLTQEDLAHYDGGFDTSRRCICYLGGGVCRRSRRGALCAAQPAAGCRGALHGRVLRSGAYG